MRQLPTVNTHSENHPRRTRRARCVALLAVVLFISSATATAWAAAPAGPPPGLPGPPPGAGSGFPAPPAVGSTPGPQPLGPASTIPSHVSGPGLTNGTAHVQGRKFSLAIACQGGGRVTVAASSVAGGALAHASYSCRGGRAVAQLTMSAADAGKLRSLGSAVAVAKLGGQTASVTLESRSTPPLYWSDGGLECSLFGNDEPYSVAPNFTVTPAAIIDVRPWVAWYTPAHGWRWLGTNGVGSSSWYSWTATTAGVEQWVTPAGAVNPWTWAPIHVSAGQNTYAISAFEVIYWYKNLRYVWKYGPSVPSGTSVSTYCSFP